MERLFPFLGLASIRWDGMGWSGMEWHGMEKNENILRTSETRLQHQDYSVEESLLGLIVPFVREDVREPIRDQDRAITQREACGQDEAVAPREGDGGDDADARDGDGGEEEGRQAAEDGVRDRDEGGGEFGEDAHDEEEEAGAVAGFAVRAPRQRDDAVVLGECRHGGYGAEGGDEAVEAVG